MRNTILYFALGLCALFSGGCDKDEALMKITENDVRQLVDQNLKPGDSSEAIESFFTEQGLPITYDKYTNTYRSLAKSEDGSKKITVKIFLDAERRFERAEVRESFTNL